MKKIKITVIRKARYDDLIARYENPIDNACDMVEGAIFIANGWSRPDGFCLSAWKIFADADSRNGYIRRENIRRS